MKKTVRKILVRLRRLFGRTSFITNLGLFNYSVNLNEFIDWAIYMRHFESDTIRAFKQMIKPGMTIIDVGANSGFYSLLSAHLTTKTGWVHAFEPTTYGFDKLTTNISINKFSNIKTYKIALSDTTFSEEVELASSYPLRSTLKRKWTGGSQLRSILIL